MNPYDFVPIVENKPPQRHPPCGHDKFSGKSGLIECKITTLKPLLIPLPMNDKERQKQGLRELIGHNERGDPQYHEKYTFNTANGVPVIPGSSIKGILRSVAEAVANSCLTFFQKDNNKNYATYPSRKFDPAKRRPVTVYPQFNLQDDFYPCTNVDSLCITCRLFGFQSSERSFQGKVNISDAKVRNGYEILNWITLAELSNPKPHHKAFYGLSSDPNKIAGRKFYFHHKPDAPILSSRKTHRNSSVRPIENAVFDFKVAFTNLTDDEYILLLYSLFLEDRVCHKIGYGKPAGLGSVQTEPLKLTLFDIEKRYKGFVTDDKEERNDENSGKYVIEQTNIYREDEFATNLRELRRIWQWPGTHDIQYPDLKGWFLRNQNLPISETP